MPLRSKSLRIFFFSLLLVNLACEKKYTFLDANPEKIKRDDIPVEVWLPSKVWDLIANNHGADENGGHSSQSSTTAAPSGHGTNDSQQAHGKSNSSTSAVVEVQQQFQFANINVYLKEKNFEVLKQPAYRIDFGKGGGTIDLASLLGKEKGTFFVGFEFPEWIDATDIQIYFVSGYRRRRISGEIYGIGCNRILDITKAFLQNNGNGVGIVVNSTSDRHLNVIGGTFVFVAHKNKDIFLTQVTFSDSQKLHLACSEGTNGEGPSANSEGTERVTE